jgi:hypothetical protein
VSKQVLDFRGRWIKRVVRQVKKGAIIWDVQRVNQRGWAYFGAVCEGFCKKGAYTVAGVASAKEATIECEDSSAAVGRLGTEAVDTGSHSKDEAAEGTRGVG